MPISLNGNKFLPFVFYNKVYGVFHGCKLNSNIIQPWKVGDLYIDTYPLLEVCLMVLDKAKTIVVMLEYFYAYMMSTSLDSRLDWELGQIIMLKLWPFLFY
jgi:hypothetical protein